MSNIGKNIRFLRSGRNMTQDALAERLCVTRQTISNYEVGKSQPDIETLKRLAEILQVDLYEILYEPAERSVQRAKYVKLILRFALVIFAGFLLNRLIHWSAAIDQGQSQALNIFLRLLLQPAYYFLLGWLVTASVRSLYITAILPDSANRWLFRCVLGLSSLLLLALFPYYSVMLTVLGIPYIRVSALWMNVTHWITRNQHFIWLSLLLGAIAGLCVRQKHNAA